MEIPTQDKAHTSKRIVMNTHISYLNIDFSNSGRIRLSLAGNSQKLLSVWYILKPSLNNSLEIYLPTPELL